MSKINKCPNHRSLSGSSFHDTTIRATLNELKQILGDPGPGDGYKVLNEWELELESGELFTVYDWKEGRYGADTYINWHIGGFSRNDTETALREIMEELLYQSWRDIYLSNKL
jgi:hypothetical protein